MRILIDALGIVNKTTGVGQYSYQLLKQLSIIDRNNNYIILVNSSLQNTHPLFELADEDNFMFRRTDIPAIGFRRQVKYFLRIRKKYNYDLFHCLNSNFPLSMTKGSIVTIHDLKYLKFPEYLGRGALLKKYYLNFIFRQALEVCQEVIAVSRNTKNDLIELFEIKNTDKINVIYEAANLDFGYSGKVDILKKYSIAKPYFLFLGEHRPHKNISGLIKAFDYFKRGNKYPDYKLVVTGKKHPSYRQNLDNISERTRKDIIFTGFVPEQELPCLYKNSFAFLLISFYEGFGIPVLEAMQSGVPVITSDVSSMPEIAGDAALKVTPDDYKEVADKMRLLIEDEDLYNELKKRGSRRVAEFSWEKAATETLHIYRKVYNNSRL